MSAGDLNGAGFVVLRIEDVWMSTCCVIISAVGETADTEPWSVGWETLEEGYNLHISVQRASPKIILYLNILGAIGISYAYFEQICKE